jgi:hypothetical protein
LGILPKKSTFIGRQVDLRQARFNANSALYRPAQDAGVKLVFQFQNACL